MRSAPLHDAAARPAMSYQSPPDYPNSQRYQRRREQQKDTDFDPLEEPETIGWLVDEELGPAVRVDAGSGFGSRAATGLCDQDGTDGVMSGIPHASIEHPVILIARSQGVDRC